MSRIDHIRAWILKWSGWFSILFLFMAAVSYWLMDAKASPVAYLLAAFMMWSRPFEENRAKGKPTLSDTARIAIGLTSAMGAVLLLPKSDVANVAKFENVAANADIFPEVPETSCGANGHVTRTDFAVQTTVPLRTRPDPKADQVSIPFGVDQEVKPVSIDQTMPVREFCRSGQWSKVRVLMRPSDIGRAQGWVPTSALRAVKTDPDGRRIYEASDIEFSDGSRRYEAATVAVINRVMAQNPKCDAINNLILVDQDRKEAKLHFACFGAVERGIDFTPADATNGRSFAPAKPAISARPSGPGQPVQPIALSDAVLACEDAARDRITHSSTADFSILGADFQSSDDGTSTFTTTFTARNGFNLELNFQLLCEFTGSQMTDIQIVEAK